MIYYLAQVFKEYRIVSDEGTRTVLGTYAYIIYNSALLAQGKPKKQTHKLGTVLVRLFGTMCFPDLIWDVGKLVVSNLILLNSLLPLWENY